MNILSQLIKMGNREKEIIQLNKELKGSGLTVCGIDDSAQIQLYNGIDEVAEMFDEKIQEGLHGVDTNTHVKWFVFNGVKYYQLKWDSETEFAKLGCGIRNLGVKSDE
jgi:hypothetical protein